MASSISFELHLEALDRLCYVCGEIIMKSGHEIAPTLHADMVETFTIHSHLQTEVSPKGICYTCLLSKIHTMFGSPSFIDNELLPKSEISATAISTNLLAFRSCLLFIYFYIANNNQKSHNFESPSSTILPLTVIRTMSRRFILSFDNSFNFLNTCCIIFEYN